MKKCHHKLQFALLNLYRWAHHSNGELSPMNDLFDFLGLDTFHLAE